MKKAFLISVFLLTATSIFADGGRQPITLDHKGGPRSEVPAIMPEAFIDYEIEASGTVTLEDGFQVEKGASFAVYPACF